MKKKTHSSLSLAQNVFRTAAEGKRLAEKRKREMQRREMIEKAFPFLKLPIDLQEKCLQYLPSWEMGMCCAVSKKIGHIYQFAAASIFAEVVGVARGKSKLVRQAELRLIHRLRNTHDKSVAVETVLWAAFNGYNEYVLRLIQKGAVDVNDTGSPDWDSATILHVACRQGNAKLVKSLLDLGAQPACLTKSRQTPLILACEYGAESVVKWLLDHCGRSLNVNNQDGGGRTALFAACEKGHSAIVDMLVDWGDMMQQTTGESEPVLNLNLGNVEWGSPLNIAARYGQSRIVRTLLKSQAGVNLVTEDGRSAVFCAVERGALQTTKLILEERPPVTGSEMAQMLYQARPQSGMEAAVQLAETCNEIPNIHPNRAGTLVDLASNTGKTPVFVAAERGNTPLLQVLIDAKADTNKPTFLNKTPLYAATEQGHTEVVKCLLQFCTREQVLHQTNFGTTAVFMAQRNGHMAIKALLSDFCVERLTVEKKKKRKSKRSQSQAMDRLFLKKKGQKAGTRSVPASREGNTTSQQSKREKLDADISRSKLTISNLSENLESLGLAVEEIYAQQRQGRGETARSRISKVSDLIGEIIEDKVGDDEELLQKIESLETNSDVEENEIEEETAATEEVRKPTIVTPVLFPDPTDDTGPAEDEEEPTRVEESETDAENTKKPTPQDVRRSRAAFFEKKFSKESEVEERHESQQIEGGTRLIPKKGKDVMTARKWSENFIDTEDEEQSNNDGSSELTLKTIRASLLGFSTITSSYKMPEEVFSKSFQGNAQAAVRPIFELMKGSHQTANAWDVFVASTLSTNAKADEKLSFCFGLFDSKSQGFIDRSVAKAMIRCCGKAVAKLQSADNAVEGKEDLERVLNDLTTSSDIEHQISKPQFVEWAKYSSEGSKIFETMLK